MKTLDDIRKEYPQYDKLSDPQLADALRNKFYPDMLRSDFYKSVGLEPPKMKVSREQMQANVTTGSQKYSSRLSRWLFGLTRPGRIDPQTGRPYPPNQALDVLTRPIVEGGTLGLGDEARAAGAGVAALTQGGSFTDEYNKTLEAERAANQREALKNPKLNTALRIVGGVGSTMTAPGAALANATLKETVKQSAKGGAAIGGIAGTGSAEGGVRERIAGGAAGAAIGGVAGAAVPVLTYGVGQLISRLRGGPSSAPAVTTESLKTESTAAYKEAEAANLVVAQPAIKSMSDDLADKLAKEGLDPILHPKAMAALQRIRAMEDKPLSLQELEILRRVALSAGKSREPDEGRLAGIITDKIDDLLENLKPADIAGGDAATAAKFIDRARKLWNMTRKAQTIEDALEKAEVTTGASGGRIDTATRQKLTALLFNKSTAKLWNIEERAAIKTAIEGTTVQNMLRLFGRLSPEGSGLMLGIGAATHVLTSGATIPLQVAAFGAKKGADALTNKNAAAILELVRTGKVPPVAQLTPLQQQIIRGLTAGGTAAAVSETRKRRRN